MNNSNNMDKAIFDFITNQINKSSNSNVPEEQLRDWLIQNSPKAEKCNKASHIGKFTHPDADVKSCVFFEGRKQNDGFLRTGNVKTNSDFSRNASNSKITKFLNMEMKSNGKNDNLLKHLEKNSKYIQNQLKFLGTKKYNKIREQLLKAVKINGSVTSSEIKQVYFPVNGDYHLLSILSSSGIMLALKQKIEEMKYSNESKKARDAKKVKKYSKTGFCDIYHLTLISYGGEKPQNISDIATKLKKSYLLPSIPPSIHKKKIRLPKYNFFKDTLKMKDYKYIFFEFNKLQSTNWNNQRIREARDKWLKHFLDKIIEDMWYIRQNNPGWSDSRSTLPLYQKKWLDNKYHHERKLPEFNIMIDKVIDDMSRYFIFSYEKILKKKKVSLLDDNMLNHIKDIVENYREYLK